LWVAKKLADQLPAEAVRKLSLLGAA